MFLKKIQFDKGKIFSGKVKNAIKRTSAKLKYTPMDVVWEVLNNAMEKYQMANVQNIFSRVKEFWRSSSGECLSTLKMRAQRFVSVDF